MVPTVHPHFGARRLRLFEILTSALLKEVLSVKVKTSEQRNNQKVNLAGGKLSSPDSPATKGRIDRHPRNNKFMEIES